MNAQLRYYYPHVDIDRLSNGEWAALWSELVWVRRQEGKKFDAFMKAIGISRKT